MADHPAYVIVGRGRWARRMRAILLDEGRIVSSVEETRQGSGESESAYVSRLAEAMKRSAAQVAWLCVVPGRHVTLLIQAALEAGLHVVVEKPWYGSAEETQNLQALAASGARLLAMHFEYLLLREVERWRSDYHPGAGLGFGGRFFLSRPDHTGIPPLENLGSHLLAIREYAVPAAKITDLQCAHDRSDERLVWMEKDGQALSSINLLTHGQPIVQGFIKKVEAALDGAAFPYDLNFALRVAQALNACKTRGLA